jgi:AcrR family transcriptional regulator
MGVQERKAREREELRQEILDAARDLFGELGYEAVSMRKIAERIEYSPTTIYLYFRDKSDLLDCICSDTFGQLVERLGSISRDEPDPLQVLTKSLRAYIDFGLQHPAHYKVAFMMPHAHHCDPERPSRSDQAGQRAFRCFVQAVEACARAGRLQTDDVELTTQMLWSAIHGLTSLLITHPGLPWKDRQMLISHLLETLTKGLRNS